MSTWWLSWIQKSIPYAISKLEMHYQNDSNHKSGHISIRVSKYDSITIVFVLDTVGAGTLLVCSSIFSTRK